MSEDKKKEWIHWRNRMPDDMQCKAKSKQTGERCKNRNYNGKRVCKIHGGASKGGTKLGNKKALRTGEYETIVFESLEKDEIEFYNKHQVEPLAECIKNIKILSIREMRMLKIIKAYIDRKAESYEIARAAYEKEKSEHKEGKPDPRFKHPSTMILNFQTVSKSDSGNSSTGSHEAVDIMLLRLEEALTRVQNEKGKWIDRQARILADRSESGDSIIFDTDI